MEKPIIFFSHSSRDKKYLIALKNKILHLTSNTIEIFQSSDGESIPFGNNWVHKIEYNLNTARLMFVFVSPNSLKSNWLYFESGYSYSKGIKVIPIGINGIDIGKLAPPINLLQGFNITSFEGLNNLITVINREFSCTFTEKFDNDDYEEILSNSDNSQVSDETFKYVDYFKTNFSSRLQKNELKENALKEIITFFNDNNVKYSLDGESRVYLHGMVITQIEYGIEIKLDSLKLKENLTIILNLLEIVYTNKLSKYWIYIHFMDDVELLTTDFKLSSRLSNLGIYMSEKNPHLFEYKSLLFALDEKVELLKGFEGKRLRIVFPVETFNLNEIIELINLLYYHKLIWLKNVDV
jgi:hypothetical protein